MRFLWSDTHIAHQMPHSHLGHRSIIYPKSVSFVVHIAYIILQISTRFCFIILRPSYLNDGISFTSKMTYVCWSRARGSITCIRPTLPQPCSNHTTYIRQRYHYNAQQRANPLYNSSKILYIFYSAPITLHHGRLQILYHISHGLYPKESHYSSLIHITEWHIAKVTIPSKSCYTTAVRPQYAIDSDLLVPTKSIYCVLQTTLICTENSKCNNFDVLCQS